MNSQKNRIIPIRTTQHSTGKALLSSQRRGRGNILGFTLIEVIVSLILIGILAAAGGMGIVQAVQGYVMVKDNATITQKAQLAMSRITREAVEMTGFSTAPSVSILPLKSVERNVTIGLDSGQIKVAQASIGTVPTLSTGDTLINNVNAFTLQYYKGSSAWATSDDINLLSAIDVTVQLTRPDGGYMTFTNRISPRNNKNLGGAAPPTAVPPAGVSYCFVATAAFGDTGHPMVMLLRDFRDRFLLTWAGGRWFVDQYYMYGPWAASMIQDRPIIKWAVRMILIPVAALTFLVLYAPWGIPFLLLSSLIVTIALFTVGRNRREPIRSSLAHQKGSVLLGLIATIVVMATLGAAMVPMFSASYMNQAGADQGRKAYFLAEAGFRYAASTYLQGGNDAAKQTILADLNNKTCTFSNNRGSFTTVVYPYWFTNPSGSGTLNLVAHIPGTVPESFPSGTTTGYVMASTTKSIARYVGVGRTGTTVTFTLNSALTTSSTTEILPVASTSGGVALSVGGNLTLISGADLFPRYNGNFTFANDTQQTGAQQQTVLNYERRIGNTLYNITLANSNATWPTATGTRVVLDKYLQLSSTGTFGGSSRRVVYNVPIGWTAGSSFEPQEDFRPNMDGFEALSGSSGFGGTHNPQYVDGSNTALQVTSAPNPTGVAWWTNTGNWAVAAFTGYSNTNLAKAWLDAEGDLSYDLQVKVYNTQPYFFAGMNFRLRNNDSNTDLYTYGVSLIKPRQSRTCIIGCFDWSAPSDQATDLIPGYTSDSSAGPLFSNPGLFENLEQTSRPLIGTQYRYGLPAIVLWERTSSGFKWLAYHKLAVTEANGGIVTYTSSSKAWRLLTWPTLMVRLVEGKALPFTGGGVARIKAGDIIKSSDGTKEARVVMTPILTSGSWIAGGNATGTLILSNVEGSFSSSENLFVDGVQLARANGSISATKQNYIRVYYSRRTAQSTPDNSETTINHRLANPRNYANWPPYDLSTLEADATHDFVTLVQWTGYNTGVSAVTSSNQPNAIIANADLLTPAWTESSALTDFVWPNGNVGDSIALVTSSGSATSTAYDDFSILLYTKSGEGFLPPIQQ